MRASPHLIPCLRPQVTKVDMEGGIVAVKLKEMTVGRVSLRFVDRETGEGREEGATRPDIILRQMTTRPGQVRCTTWH